MRGSKFIGICGIVVLLAVAMLPGAAFAAATAPGTNLA